MKIRIWIVDFGSLSDLLEYPLIWETLYVPLLGDNLDFSDYNNEPLDFMGKVVERTFTIGTDEVLLDIKVDNDTYDMLSNYLKKFRAKKVTTNE